MHASSFWRQDPLAGLGTHVNQVRHQQTWLNFQKSQGGNTWFQEVCIQHIFCQPPPQPALPALSFWTPPTACNWPAHCACNRGAPRRQLWRAGYHADFPAGHNLTHWNKTSLTPATPQRSVQEALELLDGLMVNKWKEWGDTVVSHRSVPAKWGQPFAAILFHISQEKEGQDFV